MLLTRRSIERCAQLTEDLHDLEEMGLIPDESEPDEMDVEPATTSAPASAPALASVPSSNHGAQLIGRDITSIPWFESIISGSRLANMHTTKGVRQSRDGRTRVEFEITEWTGNDQADDDAEVSESSTTGGLTFVLCSKVGQ